MYSIYLERYKNDNNLVFHCDIRDTFFQKDVFKYYKSNKSFLVVVLEDDTLSNEMNKKWILNYACEQKYKFIKNESIICLDSLLGTPDKFLEFSKTLYKNLKDNLKDIDQGITNYSKYYLHQLFFGIFLLLLVFLH